MPIKWGFIEAMGRSQWCSPILLNRRTPQRRSLLSGVPFLDRHDIVIIGGWRGLGLDRNRAQAL